MATLRMHDRIKVQFDGAGTNVEVVDATYKGKANGKHKVRLDEDADVAGVHSSGIHKYVDRSQILV